MNKKHSRIDILEKGQEIIRLKGFNNTGINDILKASGIPKGTFYNFFSSKEGFGIQLLDYYTQKNLKRIDAALSNPKQSPLERLKSFYHHVIALPDQPEAFGGCLIYNMASEMGNISDALAKATHRNFMLWVKRIAQCIKEAQSQGEISPHFNALELAEFIHTGISGSMARAKATRSSAPLALMYQYIFDYIEGAHPSPKQNNLKL